jgi:hypothetical protein
MMEKVHELHEKAMEISDLAEIERLKKNHVKSLRMYQEAFELEKQAAELLTGRKDVEPTRSVLFRSAASLALICNNSGEAVRLVDIGLDGNPPAEIEEELMEIKEGITNND